MCKLDSRHNHPRERALSHTVTTRYMTTMHAARRARRTELWHVCNSDVGGKSGRAILSFAVLSPPFTDSSQPRSLVDPNFAGLLPRAIAQFGDRPAIVLRGRETSFAGLGRRAAAIATRLTELGVTPGDVCAILARDPADAAAAFFAVLSVGAIGTNLNELYRPRQIEFVLSHSRARVLIIGREVLNALPREIVTNARLLILQDIGESRDELNVGVRRGEDRAGADGERGDRVEGKRRAALPRDEQSRHDESLDSDREVAGDAHGRWRGCDEQRREGAHRGKDRDRDGCRDEIDGDHDREHRWWLLYGCQRRVARRCLHRAF